mmetsp:Transcript_172170/g.551878  ORF Transcript_172170/g.551878 Transcript_172170/m.551878 type:complete len:436 (-) Transcript_172170:39-1346(-)
MVNKRKPGASEEASGPGPTSKSVNANFMADPKLEQGKQQTLDKVSGFKGPSSKDMKQERKIDVMRKLAKEKEKVSWKKQAGTIAAIVCLCGAGLAQFISTVLGFLQGDGIATVDAKDTAMLKTVLFSGEPWLVYCVNDESRSQRLPQVLQDSANDLQKKLGLKTAVLGCWDQTGSGRSVALRFKLNLKPPLSFVVANGNKPRTINLLGISKAEELEKRIKPALKIETYRIDALKKWGTLCTSRKSCVVIGHKNQAQRDFALGIVRPLLETHRATKVVTLDTSFWQMKLSDGVLATRSAKDKGKGAEVLCLARDEGGIDGNTTHSGAFLQDLDASTAAAFLTACEARSDLVRLDAVPRINARPSKPKKVTPPSPSPSPSPQPPASKTRDAGNKDRVGSRQILEEEEPLFEAVDEEDQVGGGEEDEEGEDDGDEVEL